MLMMVQLMILVPLIHILVSGVDAIEFMESLVVGDIEGLKENHGTLSVFTNDNGTVNDLTTSDSYFSIGSGCDRVYGEPGGGRYSRSEREPWYIVSVHQ